MRSEGRRSGMKEATKLAMARVAIAVCFAALVGAGALGAHHARLAQLDDARVSGTAEGAAPADPVSWGVTMVLPGY